MTLLQKTNINSVLTPLKKLEIIESIIPKPKLNNDYNPAINSNTIIYPNKPINDYAGFLTQVNWGDIKGDIELQKDLINKFISEKISYDNQLIGVNNVKEALDLINDKLFYKDPDPVNANFIVTCYRNNKIVNLIYKGMIIDTINYKWNINNYENYISSIMLNNQLVTGTNYTESIQLQNYKRVTLSIISDYKDSKGNSPKPYQKSIDIVFKDKLFYWISPHEGEIDSISKIQFDGSLFNISIPTLQYIYLLFPTKLNWIHIYEQGGVDPGGNVTNFITAVNYKEYDVPITYYLYRSINALKGNWTIKHL